MPYDTQLKRLSKFLIFLNFLSWNLHTQKINMIAKFIKATWQTQNVKNIKKIVLIYSASFTMLNPFKTEAVII